MPTIDRFLSVCEDIDNCNYGGCLFMAFAFYRFIRREEPESEFKVVQYSYGRSAIDQNLRFIEGSGSLAGSSSHFTWIHNGIEYDSGGEFHDENCRIRAVLECSDEILEEFFEDALLNGSWNDSFNRYQATNILYDELDIDMSDCLETVC